MIDDDELRDDAPKFFWRKPLVFVKGVLIEGDVPVSATMVLAGWPDAAKRAGIGGLGGRDCVWFGAVHQWLLKRRTGECTMRSDISVAPDAAD